MGTCLFVIALALLWLFRESDWLRLRMVVGAVVTSCPWAPRPTHRLCYQWFDREGNPTDAAGLELIILTRKDFENFPFSPGIDTPLCGWKWIEGRYHPATKKGAIRLRADEFKPQLYHLGNDPSERREVAGKNPEIARRLSQLLDRYRTQGHSRTGSSGSPKGAADK